MNHRMYDMEYVSIINEIIENEEFNKMKYIDHHGISRYEHMMKISYRSYKIAKRLKLDYVSVARAGLLHDFYPTDINRDKKEQFFSTFNHAKRAEEYSSVLFDLNEKEKDIIKTHMFPVSIRLTMPRYMESWVVNVVDKVIGGKELLVKAKFKFAYALNFYLIFLLNSTK